MCNWRMRSVTSHSHGSKFSGSLQSLLTETVKVRLNDWRKVWATVLFLRAVIYVSFLVFSSAICALSQFVEMEKFCYHGKVTKRLLLPVSALVSHVNKEIVDICWLVSVYKLPCDKYCFPFNQLKVLDCIIYIRLYRLSLIDYIFTTVVVLNLRPF